MVERSVYRHGSGQDELDEIIINPFAKRSEPLDDEATAPTSDLPALPLDFKSWQHQQEKTLLEMALKQGRFNQRKAADLLGLTYHQLRGMLRKHALLQGSEPEGS